MGPIIEMATKHKSTLVSRWFSGWVARHIYSVYPYETSVTGRVLQFPSARRSVEINSARA